MDGLPNLPPDLPGKGRKSPPRKKPARKKQPAQPPLPSLPDLATLGANLPTRTASSSTPASPRRADDAFRIPTPTERALNDIGRTLKELSSREREAIRLYEPLPLQDRFHRSRVKTRLLRGSNRGGKTLPAAVEVARAWLGLDPYGKYPARGVWYMVGYDYAHHGETTYPKLFKPGAFRVIVDRRTGRLRAYRPWDEDDRARFAESAEAEPLIPERYIDDISWYSKKEEIPSLIRLTTGWVIQWYSGDGKPPRGQAIDGGWLDEEIANRYWYNELISRTADRDGKVIWSAAPQSGTDQLYELHELAETQADDPDKVVEEFHVRLADNPHLSERQKAEMAASKTSEAALITDIEGEFLYSTQKVLGEYSLRIHGIDLEEIPDYWTRFAVIDPGHQICAVLFAALPPPDEQPGVGDVVLYDELYIQRCSAAMLADKMLGKVTGLFFEDFIIDRRGSRVSDAGSGKSVEEHYREEFAKRGVKCRVHGSGFTWGSDDVDGAVESVRAYLRIGNAGVPRLRVWTERADNGQTVSRLPNFEWEIARWRMKKVQDVVTDKPEDRGRVHLMACLRYLCAYQPRYVRPPDPEPEESPVYKEFVRKQAMNGGRRVGLTFGVGRSA